MHRQALLRQLIEESVVGRHRPELLTRAAAAGGVVAHRGGSVVAPCEKRIISLFRVFPMFVPSLSW